MNKGSDIIQKNVNVIPQVFYDIIARIVPGLVLIGCSAVVYLGPEDALQKLSELVGTKEKIKSVSFSFGVILIIASYLLSLITIGIRHYCIRLYNAERRRMKKQNEKLKKDSTMVKKAVFFSSKNKKWKSNFREAFATSEKLKRPTDGKNTDEVSVENLYIPSLHYVYDYVRILAPDIGSRLVKLNAEIHMCSVILIGFYALGIWNECTIIKSLLTGSPVGLSRINLGMFFIVAITALFLLIKELEGRYTRGLSDSWFILKSLDEAENIAE